MKHYNCTKLSSKACYSHCSSVSLLLLFVGQDLSMFSGTLKSFKPFFFCFKNLRCTDFFDDTRFRQQMQLVVNTGQNEIAVLMGEAFIDFTSCAATVTSIPWACRNLK